MSSEDKLLVIGVGASAGGVEALQKFFQAMPEAHGMAFLLMTHQRRGQESALPEIVARATRMPVSFAEDGARIEAGRVYVCPPDQAMTLADGVLSLVPAHPEAGQKLIDLFFAALAEDRKEASVGILLSGSGTDGALGMKAIKEHGGFTMAQGHNGSAPGHSGMPDTAVAAGVVDVVLPVEELPARLLTFAQNFREVESIDDAQLDVDEEMRDAQRTIARILLGQVGHDFSGYKEKTFMRRVRRRMSVLQISALDEYIQILRESPDEVTHLFRDLLIGVTAFFRDADAFAMLESQVIPRLFDGKGPADSVRVWVPGCATGEEVYSLAIMLREHMNTMKAPPKVQVFATDIDDGALGVARAGRYPVQSMDAVSPERRKRFFTGDDLSLAVSKDLRDMCIFSEHSVIRDPPFSRMDLISCRNLLIYLGSEFQSHVVPVFHFALKPRGYLFLGTSENVGQFSDLFTAIDKKQRIFQRRDHVSLPLNFSHFSPLGRPAPTAGEMRREPGAMATALRRAVDTRMLERHTPAHVVINREGDILHYSPRTGKYLEPAAGLPNRQLIAMARRGLRLELRGALREALEARRMVTRRNITVELEDRLQPIDLTIEPLGDDDNDPLFLVVFDDVAPPQAHQEAVRHESVGDRTADRLEQELRDTRERLQSTIEEYETAVEELKSSNEELQSMNEELQSTNEEMETAKEELQSVNEELHTINAELNSKVEEVDRANADLRNVFESTQIATIFLDRGLVIRSFTPAVAGLFNLISSDKGRPLTDIVSNLEGEGDLRRDVQFVLETGETRERRVTRRDNAAHYLMRILPYRTHPSLIDGVLITFIQVTKMVEAEAHQRTLIEELNHRVRNMLTVIGAIAKQTLVRTPSPERFTEAFLGRLQSMANSYNLIAKEQWGSVGLADILKSELASFSASRITLDGPPVTFKPARAVALGLVVHELATNAAKYGAFAGPAGRVSVAWRIEDGQVLLEWVESDGPQVKPPERRGFGTELIERQVASALDGKAVLDYAPEGLRVKLSIPAPSP